MWLLLTKSFKLKLISHYNSIKDQNCLYKPDSFSKSNRTPQTNLDKKHYRKTKTRQTSVLMIPNLFKWCSVLAGPLQKKLTVYTTPPFSYNKCIFFNLFTMSFENKYTASVAVAINKIIRFSLKVQV